MIPLVIGIGNRWRCDDALGPLAIDALAERLPDNVDLLVLDGEPARVVTAWRDRPWVLVIDAIATGAGPGTITVVAAEELHGRAGRCPSSHGAGLDTAVQLGRALECLPERLILAGIEPADLGHGEALSGPVAAAFEPLLDRIEAEVRSACA